jgi:hypothetical protein
MDKGSNVVCFDVFPLPVLTRPLIGFGTSKTVLLIVYVTTQQENMPLLSSFYR